MVIDVDLVQDVSGMRCPTCGQVQEAGVMCGKDGSLLVDARAVVIRDHPERGPCPGCGAALTVRDENGACRKCGADWTTPSDDRIEIELGRDLAAVSDRCSARTHRVNQDAVWISRGMAGNKPYVIMGVADGVSRAYRSQVASAVAVSRSCVGTAQGLEAGRTDVASLLRDAILDASLAVRLLPYEPEAMNDQGQALSPPSTTLVMAVAWGLDLTFACIGDSRGYAGHPGALVQCTHDDSWLQRMLDAGATESEAMLDPRAHAISRWIGPIADAPEMPPFEPNIFTAQAAPGMLVAVVSDGVWGYLPHIVEFNGALARPDLEGASALELCRALVNHAKSFDGGEDNASAAIMRVGDAGGK